MSVRPKKKFFEKKPTKNRRFFSILKLIPIPTENQHLSKKPTPMLKSQSRWALEDINIFPKGRRMRPRPQL
jgi:hypothetical protein